MPNLIEEWGLMKIDLQQSSKNMNQPDIQVLRPKFIPMRCPTCNGFGTVSYGQKVCPGCQGQTWIPIPPADELEQKDNSKNERGQDDKASE